MRGFPRRLSRKLDFQNTFSEFPEQTAAYLSHLAAVTDNGALAKFGFTDHSDLMTFSLELNSPTLVSPYVTKATSAKVGLHAHTNASDGTGTSDQMMAAALAAGFDAYALTDHDYGEGLPTATPTTEGIIYIPGIEITLPGHHNTFVGRDLVQWNHPIHQYLHPEIYGTNPDHPTGLVEIFNSDRYDSSLLVDNWLSKGEQFWLSAGGDSHSTATVNWCWNIVYLDSISAENIFAALASGNFYCSSYPDLNIVVGTNCIYVSSSHHCNFRFIGKSPTVDHIVDGHQYHGVNNATSAYYFPTGNEGYIRVVATELYDQNRKAYSQPIYFD